MRQCKATNKEGKRCGAWPMKGSDYCFMHDPGQKEARALAVKKGGRALKKVKVNLSPLEFEGGIPEVVNLLVESIDLIRQNKISTKKATCIGYLANILLKALEGGQIEERLEKIERIVLERRTYS